jgi:Ala-tRNA(Pro) deacylase
MAIAMTLQRYLNKSGVDYDVLPHPYTTSSISTAEAAAVPGDKLAKSVILEDDQGYLMAVIPATHHIHLGMLSQQMHRHLGLATESEIATLFNDCVLGAIPPVGHPYGMRMIMDDSLQESPDVYFESGDHVDLVHMRSEDFLRLNEDASHGYFSRHI